MILWQAYCLQQVENRLVHFERKKYFQISFLIMNYKYTYI